MAQPITSDERVTPAGTGKGKLFNLPATFSGNRAQIYAEVIGEFADGRALDILEIGVFRAGLRRGVATFCPQAVKSYLGVDPYLGDENDPYLNAYWGGKKSNADQQFEDSSAIFEKLGSKILRMTSDDFFAQNDQQFDLIIVDGDHRLNPALTDLKNALAVLRPGGLLVCDDYGNPDTPEVTRAAVRFVEFAGEFYDAHGFRPIWFQKGGKPAPIQLSIVYWRKRS